MGAQLVKEVSTKTNDVAGDGTTTATLLAQAIIREGLKNLAAGANPMVMKKGIAKAPPPRWRPLRPTPRKVNGSADIARVGTVSSSDETVGKLIAEAMEKVSHDASSPWRSPRPPRPIPRWLRACSLTGAISPPICHRH